MGKVNVDKIGDFNPIRTERQSGDVKKSIGTTAQIFESKPLGNGDKLEISGRGSEVGKFVTRIKDLPDVRQEKIKSLRESVASGKYSPPSEKIADAILKDENF